jgi:hypothetical protein
LISRTVELGSGAERSGSIVFDVDWNGATRIAPYTTDTTNIGGTTTANAATTITGSSTNFWGTGADALQVGDQVSLSSASSTYATVVSIASGTSMVVSAALGDGTSQTINRRRPTLNVANNFFANGGGLLLGAPAAGVVQPASGQIVNGSATAGVAIQGTKTNDSANAGDFGQDASVSRLASAATAVTSATALNVTASALSLTAGDWDVQGTVCFVSAATTSVTNFTAAVSKTSATLPAADTTGVPTSGEYINQNDIAAMIPSGTNCFTIPAVRESLSGTTSIYLVAKSSFSVSTQTVYGSLTARRAR